MKKKLLIPASNGQLPQDVVFLIPGHLVTSWVFDVDTERHLADRVFVVMHQTVQHHLGRLQYKKMKALVSRFGRLPNKQQQHQKQIKTFVVRFSFPLEIHIIFVPSCHTIVSCLELL